MDQYTKILTAALAALAIYIIVLGGINAAR